MPVKCNKKAIVDCGDCEDAGKQCVRQSGNTEKCADLGWSSKTGKCLSCPKEPVKTCDDCIRMGNKCIEQVSLMWTLL